MASGTRRPRSPTRPNDAATNGLMSAPPPRSNNHLSPTLRRPTPATASSKARVTWMSDPPGGHEVANPAGRVDDLADLDTAHPHPGRRARVGMIVAIGPYASMMTGAADASSRSR